MIDKDIRFLFLVLFPIFIWSQRDTGILKEKEAIKKEDTKE